MKLKGSTLQSDGGVEYKSTQATDGSRNSFTEMVNSFGISYVQVSRRTCVHVEARNGDIRRAINSRLAASGSKKWTGLVTGIIKAINTSSASDHRAPHTPAEITGWSAAKQRKLFFEHRDAKKKRNNKLPSAKVTINVGDWVRVALEPRSKGEMQKKKGPVQKYSSKSYQVENKDKNNLYRLKGLKTRRFPFYMLQKIPKQKDYAGNDKIAARAAKIYKPQKPRVAPGKPQGGRPGSKELPFKNKAAARAAGFRIGDSVFYKYGRSVRGRL